MREGKTGPFPKSPKDPREFRARQMESMKGFAGSVPETGFNAMRDDSKIDPFPKFKAGGSLSNAGNGREGHDTGTDVNVGSGLAPKKARPFKSYAPITKPPQGRALPVRGEGPSGGSGLSPE